MIEKVIDLDVEEKKIVNATPVISYFMTWNLPPNVYVGDKVDLYWKVNKADSISINCQPISVDHNNMAIYLKETGKNIIRLSATNCHGTTSKEIQLDVLPRKNVSTFGVLELLCYIFGGIVAIITVIELILKLLN